MKKRTAIEKRKTTETDITVKLNIDGSGKAKIKTPIGLLNHMLELFAFHGLFDLEINATGDFKKVDIHHTNEDVGIVLGKAFKKALGDMKGIKRFGSASAPMEDAVANVAVDISGRGYFKEAAIPGNPLSAAGQEKEYDGSYANHFFESFAKNMGINLSIKLSSSNLDLHTNLEPIFKALGIALDQATQIDPRRKGVPSTKGVID
ncbi:MAG: imidazoleglycerol-phosphate dehydratase HisB [Candidatus Omnitrophica bacterium]|nr:imidazoleglycerol-phosphate dehydratase HisB [Candidatus Omnitrophota bacterium]